MDERIVLFPSPRLDDVPVGRQILPKKWLGRNSGYSGEGARERWRPRVDADPQPGLAVDPLVQHRTVGNVSALLDRLRLDPFFQPAQTERQQVAGGQVLKPFAGK